MGNEHIEDLWKKPKFTNRILSFVFDEAHCISQWGDFRNDYRHVGALRWLIPSHIPFYVPSATLPNLVLKDIQEVLRLREKSTTYIKCSNDRPEIVLAVRQLQRRVSRTLIFLSQTVFTRVTHHHQSFLSSSITRRRLKQRRFISNPDCRKVSKLRLIGFTQLTHQSFAKRRLKTYEMGAVGGSAAQIHLEW